MSFSAKYLKDNYFDLNEIKIISVKQHLLNPRTEFQLNDVIISIVETIVNISKFLSILDMDKEKFYSIYNETYTKYKSNKIKKDDVLVSMTGTIGNVQPYVNISNFSNLIVPLINKDV